MNKEIEPEVDDVPEIEEVLDEAGNDITDWKELALKNQGIAKRYKTKWEKEKAKEKAEKPIEKPVEKSLEKPEKSNELTDAQKALLVAYGIKGKEKHALALEIMDRTGITSIDTLIEDDYFQSRVQKLEAAKAAQDALPQNKRSSSPASKDSVEHWMDKPFAEVPQDLREKVLNAKIVKEKKESMFTDKPILM